MIFVCFGNVPAYLTFMRMAKAVDALAASTDEEVFVQSGNAVYEFRHARAVPFLCHEEMTRKMQESSVVIVHGGWGSISEASDLGCKIVAMPRIKGKEHNHDQWQLVKALEHANVLFCCENEKDLPALVEQARTHQFSPIQYGDASKVINEFISSL